MCLGALPECIQLHQLIISICCICMAFWVFNRIYVDYKTHEQGWPNLRNAELFLKIPHHFPLCPMLDIVKPHFKFNELSNWVALPQLQWWSHWVLVKRATVPDECGTCHLVLMKAIYILKSITIVHTWQLYATQFQNIFLFLNNFKTLHSIEGWYV